MKRWVNRLTLFLQTLVAFVLGIVAITFIYQYQDKSSGNHSTALIVTFLLIVLALIVHEVGHYAGARLSGMTVRLMNIGALEFHVQRRGWRLRWSETWNRRVSGFVLASPDLERPMRRQMIGLILGGPLGNVVVALMTAFCGLFLTPQAWAYLLFAFSILNVALGVANLVPHQGVAASDGLRLLVWIRGVSESAPNLAYTRLVSRSISGQTADELPQEELTTLEQQAMPMPLIALWFRLKGDQNRGDWAAAASRREQFELLSNALDPSLRGAFTELLSTIRAELAFSEAMLTGNSITMIDELLPARASWSSPWLRPRCLALNASLLGDASRCDELLEISKQRAENAIDRAVWRSEALLRGYLVNRGR